MVRNAKDLHEVIKKPCHSYTQLLVYQSALTSLFLHCKNPPQYISWSQFLKNTNFTNPYHKSCLCLLLHLWRTLANILLSDECFNSYIGILGRLHTPPIDLHFLPAQMKKITKVANIMHMHMPCFTALEFKCIKEMLKKAKSLFLNRSAIPDRTCIWMTLNRI